MDRWVLRSSSLLFSIVLCLCAIQAAQGFQRLHPCGSDATFSLNIVEAAHTKEELAVSLANIGNNCNVLIGKVSANPEQYTNERDIILFSGNPNSIYGPIISNNQVNWLDQNVSGSVVSYTNLNSRSLNGEYFATWSEELFSSLTTWCKENYIEIEYRNTVLSPVENIFQNFLLSDTGLLAIVCFFLIAASVVASLHKLRESQRIEIVSGKPCYQIRIDCCLSILTKVFQGCILGTIVVCLYVLTFSDGIRQLFVVISLCAAPLLLYTLITFLVMGSLCFVSLPSFNKIGLRHISGTALDVSKTALECLGIVITILALVSSYTMIGAQSDLLREAEAYGKIPEATRLSLIYIPNESTYCSATELQKLIELGELSGDLLLSLDVNQSMLIEDGMIDDFDCFVIVNPAYLDAIKVNVGSSGQNGMILPLPADAVPIFAKQQSEIWLNKSSLYEPAFYRYEGSGLLALGANTGKGGEVIIANNPLVMVVENLDTSWNYSGFIIPLLSSGNLFFNDYSVALELVEESEANSIVASFDNMAALSLQQAQIASQKIAVLTLSILIAIILTFAMSVQSAASWCISNNQLIFAIRSSGLSLISIAVEGLSRRIAIIGLGSFLGVIAAIFLISNNNYLAAFLTMLGIFALMTLYSVVIRCHFIHIVFQKIAARR